MRALPRERRPSRHPIQTDIPSIFQTLAAFFPVAAEVDSTDLNGPHAQLLTKHFNSLVSGNDMKWDAIEPQEGTFTFTTADAQVAFAQAHSMLVGGHWGIVDPSKLPPR